MKKPKTKTVSALGDNNCTFNSFGLAFTEPFVLDRLELLYDPDKEFKLFIDLAAKKFHIEANWKSIREHINKLRKSKYRLQTELAQIFRYISVAVSYYNKEAYIEKTKDLFLSAFQEFVYKKEKIDYEGIRDDIFLRHPFITDYFDAIYSEFSSPRRVEHLSAYEQFKARMHHRHRTEKEADKIIESLKDRLLTWWQSEHKDRGFRKFLNEMSKPGVWAGHLELYELGFYFHLSITIRRADFTINKPNFGSLPADHGLNDAQMKQLIDRGIIEVHENQFELADLKEKDVEARLNVIPNIEELASDFRKREKIKDGVVYKYSEESAQQLIERQIIRKVEERTGYFSSRKRWLFAFEKEDAMKRMVPIENLEMVMELWRRCRVYNPKILLENQHGVHWNYVKEYSPELNDFRVLKLEKKIIDEIRNAGEREANEARTKERPLKTFQEQYDELLRNAINEEDELKKRVEEDKKEQEKKPQTIDNGDKNASPYVMQQEHHHKKNKKGFLSSLKLFGRSESDEFIAELKKDKKASKKASEFKLPERNPYVFHPKQPIVRKPPLITIPYGEKVDGNRIVPVAIVTKKAQIELDEKLARDLQSAEYEECQKRCRR